MAAADKATLAFQVTGMNCQNCARHTTEAIRSVAGVANVVVELGAGRATVQWHSGASPDPAAVVAAVKRAGFAATLPTGQPSCAEAAGPCHTPPMGMASGWLQSWGFNVVFGGLITLTLTLGEWGWHAGLQGWFQWLSFVLALAVQGLCGARFYRGAWMQIKVGRSSMDTLVALGSSTAFLYSTWALLAGAPGHLYFMEAAAIITLISAGHWLEARASERAANSLRALLHLAPATARRVDPAGGESEVPVASLRRGDRVLLKPGDRVPVDGEVVEGQSAVDETMLTGESLPVEKETGSRVFAGTVNENGRLVMRVEDTGDSTALAHIIAVVQRAQNSRADIQRLADRVSSVFVPIVVLVALTTALGWGLAPSRLHGWHEALVPWLWHVRLPEAALAAAFIHAAAVLIVACPCAMGLATPAAIMAGTNAAARRGILIRDGTALEKSGTITAVVFDKTGTLTEGKVAVAACEDLRPHGQAAPPLPALALALAASSNHPLSRAVAAWAQATQPVALPIEDWQEIRGGGVQARVGDEVVRLGSLAWLQASGVTLQALSKFAANWSAKGATVLGLATGERLTALLALTDNLKAHAVSVVTQLRAMNQQLFLVTGDSPTTAAAIAQQATLDPKNVFAGVPPEQKADVVQELQRRGLRVAFVGDGINDAPALEQADLGVAVSRASDVAREAADIILLRSDIEAIPEAIGLAQATLRTIKQNLFWAFFYNAAAVPLAALGFLSPVLCAAAMGLSDVLVIGNALRLLRWRR